MLDSPCSPIAGLVPFTSLNRRAFFIRSLRGAMIVSVSASTRATSRAAVPGGAAVRICLTPGSIGVSANQTAAIELAARHGFEAVEPYGTQLARLAPPALDELAAELKAKNLVWGAHSLNVEYRRDEAVFDADMKSFPETVAALARAGVTRVGTWISPGSGSLTYLQNLRQHTRRLGAVARVLKDHGLRLGLEYVGTQTSRLRSRYAFARTLAETRELIAEIGAGNVGLVLDSWHWWQAGDTVEDILALKSSDVISVDLNDAPAGIAREQQRDNERELPMATGVIDLRAFLEALVRIGYEGPARAEPFNRTLNELDNEAACAATIVAMKRALALVR